MSNNFKRSLKNGFYQLPNSLWKYRKELSLTLHDIAILNCISYHSKGWAINFSEELSDMSESTRNRKLKQLKDKGYLKTTRRVYQDGDGYKCVGVVCDISALEGKLIELEEVCREEESNLTENNVETVKKGRINNTNNNNTNSREVSMFVSSLEKRGLEIPRNIGESRIDDLSDRQKQYLQFAGEYIENEILLEKWEHNGKLMDNSLYVLLNPRNEKRRNDFFEYGELLLQEKELEKRDKEVAIRSLEIAKVKQSQINSFINNGSLSLGSLKTNLLNNPLIKFQCSHLLPLLDNFPFPQIGENEKLLIDKIVGFLLKSKLINSDEKMQLHKTQTLIFSKEEIG